MIMKRGKNIVTCIVLTGEAFVDSFEEGCQWTVHGVWVDVL